MHKLLWRYSWRRTLLLAGLTLVASLTDGVGLVMILPVLTMIDSATPDSRQRSPKVIPVRTQYFRNTAHVETPRTITVNTGPRSGRMASKKS